MTAAVQKTFPEQTVGTLRNYDGDGNGNVKKAVGLMSKTTTLHVRHAVLYICLPSLLSLLENWNGKPINSTIYVRAWARSLLFSSNPNSLLLRN